VPKEEKSVTKSGKPGIILRKIFLKIDIHRFEKLYKKLEKESFDYLISDRYFYDSVINIEYLKEKNCHSCPCSARINSSRNPEDNKFTGSRIKCGMTKGIIYSDTAIYLQTNPELIMQRERKPDQGLEYLKRKEAIYSNTSNKWNLVTINGNRPPEIIFEELKTLI
jgi:hypothetical protein